MTFLVFGRVSYEFSRRREGDGEKCGTRQSAATLRGKMIVFARRIPIFQLLLILSVRCGTSKENDPSTMKHIIQIFAVSFVLAAAGCSTDNGLPAGARVVGGGPSISWTSKTRGTVILVEKTTRKIVATKSIDSTSFEFDATRDQNTIHAALGSVRTNAQFVLYFVPEHK